MDGQMYLGTPLRKEVDRLLQVKEDISRLSKVHGENDYRVRLLQEQRIKLLPVLRQFWRD